MYALPRTHSTRVLLINQKSDAANIPPKKVSSKVTKAQRRAAQAEFNRKLWEEAYVFCSGTEKK